MNTDPSLTLELEGLMILERSLGIPLFHKRVQYVLEMVRKKLNGWDIITFSLIGRIILEKLILLFQTILCKLLRFRFGYVMK